MAAQRAVADLVSGTTEITDRLDLLVNNTRLVDPIARTADSAPTVLTKGAAAPWLDRKLSSKTDPGRAGVRAEWHDWIEWGRCGLPLEIGLPSSVKRSPHSMSFRAFPGTGTSEANPKPEDIS